ncbi:Carboxypeptidase [Mycena kentingensis (nom. inval.)]|nr:Carboxypeptidase [Mycena kentingensis (nom. inval.)]
MYVNPDHRLPPELEREIFIAACSKRSDITTLLLVAQRVRIWLEPLLYRTITLSDASTGINDTFRTTLNTKPPAFLAHAVRNIVVNLSSSAPDTILEQICTVLRACSNSAAIAINANSNAAYCVLVGCMNALAHPPRRLAVFLGELAAAVAESATATPSLFAPPPALHAFSRLTHLATLDGLHAEFCTRLPVLTHLAAPLPRRIYTDEVKLVLDACASLRFLVFLVPLRTKENSNSAENSEGEDAGEGPWREEEAFFAAEPLRDSRVVITDLRHWHDCIWEDEDPFWRVAEDFVEKKTERRVPGRFARAYIHHWTSPSDHSEAVSNPKRPWDPSESSENTACGRASVCAGLGMRLPLGLISACSSNFRRLRRDAAFFTNSPTTKWSVDTFRSNSRARKYWGTRRSVNAHLDFHVVLKLWLRSAAALSATATRAYDCNSEDSVQFTPVESPPGAALVVTQRALFQAQASTSKDPETGTRSGIKNFFWWCIENKGRARHVIA